MQFYSDSRYMTLYCVLEFWMPDVHNKECIRWKLPGSISNLAVKLTLTSYFTEVMCPTHLTVVQPLCGMAPVASFHILPPSLPPLSLSLSLSLSCTHARTHGHAHKRTHTHTRTRTRTRTHTHTHTHTHTRTVSSTACELMMM